MADLRGKTVVVTGSSSGLGREAAVQFARHGCDVVLGARRAHALDDTVRRCVEAGGEARFLVTDVTLESDVERLAEFALGRTGRIDVWVNNAGVTLFAPLEAAPFAEHRRVIETNVFGAMLSARTIIPIFRRQKRGVLVNVGSILSKIGHPFVPSYVVSKFALRGLSEALRTELAEEPDIHVCTLFPYAVDTPHLETGANEIGREARAMPPMQSPEAVARTLVDLACHPRRERHVPRVAQVGLALHALFPNVVERLLLRSLGKWHLGAPEAPTQGNLYAPLRTPAKVHGERPPRIGTPAFVAWAVGQLFAMEIDSVRRTVRRLGGRSSPMSAKRAPSGDDLE
jgi:NAD(P)-dependent dehydrogenase (short-subunit alcohol dehydrogenase family)